MTALFAAATAVWGSSSHRTFHEATFMEMPPCTRRSASLACSFAQLSPRAPDGEAAPAGGRPKGPRRAPSTGAAEIAHGSA